jgi:hypothetical protein
VADTATSSGSRKAMACSRSPSKDASKAEQGSVVLLLYLVIVTSLSENSYVSFQSSEWFLKL